VPTTENVALEIFRRLQPALTMPNARLHSIRLFETEDLFVEVGADA
jgi:6-pyruvoyltetrahydropterin/6-carboxytetrahydropterin synthase